MRRFRVLALDDAVHLHQLFHQVRFRVQPPRGVDDHNVGTAALGRRERVEDHRARVRALLMRDHIDAGPLAPLLKLVDRRRSESVGRSQDELLALRSINVRQLPDTSRLPRTVHSDYQDDRRLRQGLALSVRMPDLAPARVHLQRLDQVFLEHAQGLLRVPDRLSLDSLAEVIDDLHGGRHPRIRSHERFFQFLPELLAQPTPEHPADTAEPRPPCALDCLVDGRGGIKRLHFRHRRDLVDFGFRLARFSVGTGRLLVLLSPE